jgi:hypothetical protein
LQAGGGLVRGTAFAGDGLVPHGADDAAPSTLGLYAHAFAALTASPQLLPPPLCAAMLAQLHADVQVRA